MPRASERDNGIRSHVGSSIHDAITGVSARANSGLVNGKAADTYAAITREQFDNWLTTFYPKQKELLEKTQSGELLQEQLGRVDSNMAGSMRAATQAQENQMGRYGVKAESDPNQDAKQALANTTARNSLREYEQERSLSVLAGANANAMQQMEV